MNSDPHSEFQLGDWHVTPLRGLISSPDGHRRITPKAMDVLLCMAKRPGEVVDRETFQEEVWQGRVFSDDPLNKCIAELRRQLGDRSGARAYIETIPKRGYRLVAEVTPVGEAAAPATRERKGLTRHLRAIALAILVVFAGFGIWRLTEDVVPGGGIAIAVLPFENLSESGKQYFADGVHEELIAELSQGNALAVRSRTSTLQYRDREQALLDIANALSVDVVVDGSVREDGETVRVTAELIDAGSDENLWAGSIEKSLSVASLFEIQSEIAQEIATALKVTLGNDDTPRQERLPTENLDAYDAFMLGKFHYRRQLPGDIRESVLRFEQAVALDPGFADAWDWLAYAYNHAATGVGYLAPSEAYPKARTAALRALEIEPDLATAQSILGYIRAVYDRDWVGAVADLERALELDPNDSGTVWSLAHVYSMLGRHDEAVRLTREFADRFPTRGRHYQEVANRLLDAGRYEEALELLDVASDKGAEPAGIVDTRGVVYVSLGRLEEAAETFEFAVGARQRDAATVGRLAWTHARLGRRADAMALLEELKQRAPAEHISPLVFATVHAGLGDAEAAIGYLRTAFENGGREIIGIRNDAFLEILHGHPEFEALVASLALPTP